MISSQVLTESEINSAYQGRFTVYKTFDAGVTGAAFLVHINRPPFAGNRRWGVIKVALNSPDARLSLINEKRVLLDPDNRYLPMRESHLPGYEPTLCRAFEELRFNDYPAMLLEFLGPAPDVSPDTSENIKYNYQPLDLWIPQYWEKVVQGKARPWNAYQILKILYPFVKLLAEAHQIGLINSDLEAAKAGCLFYNERTGQLKNIDWGNVVDTYDANYKRSIIKTQDVQGMGGIIYYMATGKLKSATEVPTTGLEVCPDPDLRPIIERAVKTHEANAYQDAKALLQDFESVLVRYEKVLEEQLDVLRNADATILENNRREMANYREELSKGSQKDADPQNLNNPTVIKAWREIRSADLPQGRWLREADLWKQKWDSRTELMRKAEKAWYRAEKNLDVLSKAEFEPLSKFLETYQREWQINFDGDKHYPSLIKLKQGDANPNLRSPDPSDFKLLLNSNPDSAATDLDLLLAYWLVWLYLKRVNQESSLDSLKQLFKNPDGMANNEPTRYSKQRYGKMLDAWFNLELPDSSQELAHFQSIEPKLVEIKNFNQSGNAAADIDKAIGEMLERQFGATLPNMQPDFDLPYLLAQRAGQPLVWRTIKRVLITANQSTTLQDLLESAWKPLTNFNQALKVEDIRNLYKAYEYLLSAQVQFQGTDDRILWAEYEKLTKTGGVIETVATSIRDIKHKLEAEDYQATTDLMAKLPEFDRELQPGVQKWVVYLSQAQTQKNMLTNILNELRKNLPDRNLFSTAKDSWLLTFDSNPLVQEPFYQNIKKLLNIFDEAAKKVNKDEAVEPLFDLFTKLYQRRLEDNSLSTQFESIFFWQDKLHMLADSCVGVKQGDKKSYQKFETLYKNLISQGSGAVSSGSNSYNNNLLYYYVAEFFKNWINDKFYILKFDEALENGDLGTELNNLLSKIQDSVASNSRQTFVINLRKGLEYLQLGNLTLAENVLKRLIPPKDFTGNEQNLKEKLDKTVEVSKTLKENAQKALNYKFYPLGNESFYSKFQDYLSEIINLFLNLNLEPLNVWKLPGTSVLENASIYQNNIPVMRPNFLNWQVLFLEIIRIDEINNVYKVLSHYDQQSLNTLKINLIQTENTLKKFPGNENLDDKSPNCLALFNKLVELIDWAQNYQHQPTSLQGVVPTTYNHFENAIADSNFALAQRIYFESNQSNVNYRNVINMLKNAYLKFASANFDDAQQSLQSVIQQLREHRAVETLNVLKSEIRKVSEQYKFILNSLAQSPINSNRKLLTNSAQNGTESVEKQFGYRLAEFAKKSKDLINEACPNFVKVKFPHEWLNPQAQGKVINFTDLWWEHQKNILNAALQTIKPNNNIELVEVQPDYYWPKVQGREIRKKDLRSLKASLQQKVLDSNGGSLDTKPIKDLKEALLKLLEPIPAEWSRKTCLIVDGMASVIIVIVLAILIILGSRSSGPNATPILLLSPTVTSGNIIQGFTPGNEKTTPITSNKPMKPTKTPFHTTSTPKSVSTTPPPASTPIPTFTPGFTGDQAKLQVATASLQPPEIKGNWDNNHANRFLLPETSSFCDNNTKLSCGVNVDYIYINNVDLDKVQSFGLYLYLPKNKHAYVMLVSYPDKTSKNFYITLFNDTIDDNDQADSIKKVLNSQPINSQQLDFNESNKLNLRYNVKFLYSSNSCLVQFGVDEPQVDNSPTAKQSLIKQMIDGCKSNDYEDLKVGAFLTNLVSNNEFTASDVTLELKAYNNQKPFNPNPTSIMVTESTENATSTEQNATSTTSAPSNSVGSSGTGNNSNTTTPTTKTSQ